MTDSLTDRFPVVVILVGLGTALYVLVERLEQAARRREMDRAADAHRAFLEQQGRGDH